MYRVNTTTGRLTDIIPYLRIYVNALKSTFLGIIKCIIYIIVLCYQNSLVNMIREERNEDWREMSLKGEVCAVVGCQNKPSSQCPKCLVYCCYDHVVGHKHFISESEVEERKNTNESLR